MVTVLPGADPASISRLGGILRTTAATLAADARELSPDSPTSTLTTVLADRLDRVGAALHVHAQDLAEAAAAMVALHEQAAAAGLDVLGWSVLEPYGPVSADQVARRIIERPTLQARADRLSLRLARTRGQLARLVESASQDLAEAAQTARAGR